MGRLLYQVSPREKQKVLHLCVCCWGKRKNILNVLIVCMTNEKNKSFCYGYWASILSS